jgi:hypothetical protein
VNNHIRALDQPMDDLFALRMRQVDNDAPLISIHCKEEWAVIRRSPILEESGIVSRGRLDLHNISA